MEEEGWIRPPGFVRRAAFDGATFGPASSQQRPSLISSKNMNNDLYENATISTVRPSLIDSPLDLFICKAWEQPNHALFQFASGFLFLSYLAPTGIYGLLYLRCCLTLGSLFYTLWGWLVLCSLDISLWNLVFTFINAVYVLVIVFKVNPFIRFPHDIELVYRDLFLPLKVSRSSFKKIYSCTREIQTLKAEDVYCLEGETLVDKLSLLLSGRLAVLKNGKTMHLIDAHQFIDSPEWFGVGSNETYQVTVMALEECRLIIWHRDKLKLSIVDEPYLQAIMDNILGKDVVKKLLFVTDTMGSNNSYNANEHSKLIVPYHKAMDQVVKRNINKANGVHCFWSLSRITEDAETNV